MLPFSSLIQIFWDGFFDLSFAKGAQVSSKFILTE